MNQNETAKMNVTGNISVDVENGIVHIYYKGHVFASVLEGFDYASLYVYETKQEYMTIEGQETKGRRVRNNDLSSRCMSYEATIKVLPPTLGKGTEPTDDEIAMSTYSNGSA